MSRADRIKQERAEQERIRREFEKEKATAKARLAREKKRDKELAEREQKKKMGMPLVNVRPSQDTIARFARGNGSGKKRDIHGETVVPGAGPAERDEAGRELDLIPEEDESELEQLLDTITRCDGSATPTETRPEEPPQPPLSTQAILGNLEDFFPSPSQQALELQDESLDDMLKGSLGDVDFTAAAQEQGQEQAQPPPKRFFTSSGSKELMSLAIQRSKRTAALEEIQDQGILRPQHNNEILAPKQATQSKSSVNFPPRNITSASKHGTSFGKDKENIHMDTPSQGRCAVSDSQETEYGGEWVDELALELVV
jgi:hypothetical protein